eukprot:TRINITY_DN31682_c0_g1_i1.p1 TRINITY_DN31682_c0_g1~~TRINITY_DN31682_c0_g1_i1.p1  ORF type:complete len:397 (+),score=69.55 TRINITY_DN31682_c0_g1_i1:81-1271(+)
MANLHVQPEYCGPLLDGPIAAEQTFAVSAENSRRRHCCALRALVMLCVSVILSLAAFAQRQSPGNSSVRVDIRSSPLSRLDAAADAAAAAAAAAAANAAAAAKANAAAQAAANAAAQAAARHAAAVAEANAKVVARANEEAARQATLNAQLIQAKQLAAAQRLAAAHHSPKFENRTFFMYRVQSDESYPFENVNAANVPGILWYLEKEVVRSVCPRKFSITRILRFLVTVHPPKSYPHNFGEFVAFDQGVCTTPTCMKGYSKTGYVVGCQNQTGVPYRDAVWYSLPGPCPNTALTERHTSHCRHRYPGGMCSHPNGENDCTWHAEPAGVVSLSDVEGIADYNDFCANHGNEYTMPFWDGRGVDIFNNRRINQIKIIFRDKFPSMPYDMPEPSCDWG